MAIISEVAMGVASDLWNLNETYFECLFTWLNTKALIEQKAFHFHRLPG